MPEQKRLETYWLHHVPGMHHSLDIPDPFSSSSDTNWNKWTKEQEN